MYNEGTNEEDEEPFGNQFSVLNGSPAGDANSKHRFVMASFFFVGRVPESEVWGVLVMLLYMYVFRQ